MRKIIVNKDKVANLIEKIDNKKKELRQLKKELQNAFDNISNVWKKESMDLFPQLKPCNIGEYVGVDITLNERVYNIFISEYKQKLYCMFCLDRKDKDKSGLPVKRAMDQTDFDKVSGVVNDYLSQNVKKVCSTSEGYFIEFKKEQYDDVFQFYLKIVNTFIECQPK